MPKQGPIKPNYCLKLHPLYKEDSGITEISKQWSYYNCYLFYIQSFESQIEANEFCRTAFGEKYIGELAYGIGLDLQIRDKSSLRSLLTESKWKYLKSGTLKKIDDFTCQYTQEPYEFKKEFEFIGVKKDTECPMHKKNEWSGDSFIYDISTICELSGKM